MKLNLVKAVFPQERQAVARLEARQALEEVAVRYGHLMSSLATGFGEGSGAFLAAYDLDQQLVDVTVAAQRARERLRPLMIVREAA